MKQITLACRKQAHSKLLSVQNSLVDWALASMAERRATDATRTKAHDSFINSCNILSRNMVKNGEEIDWRYELGDDRK